MQLHVCRFVCRYLDTDRLGGRQKQGQIPRLGRGSYTLMSEPDTKSLGPKKNKASGAWGRAGYCAASKTSDRVSAQHMPDVCPSEKGGLLRAWSSVST